MEKMIMFNIGVLDNALELLKKIAEKRNIYIRVDINDIVIANYFKSERREGEELETAEIVFRNGIVLEAIARRIGKEEKYSLIMYHVVKPHEMIPF